MYPAIIQYIRCGCQEFISYWALLLTISYTYLLWPDRREDVSPPYFFPERPWLSDIAQIGYAAASLLYPYVLLIC